MIGKGRAWRATSVLYLTKLIHQSKVIFPIDFPSEDIIFNLNVMSIANKIAFYNNVTTLNFKRGGSISTSYNNNLVDMYLYKDNQVNKFLIQNKLNNKPGFKYQDSLLCRDIVLTLTNLMRPNNTNKLVMKYNEAQNILRIERVKNASNNKEHETPYFTSIITICYFK